MKRGIKTEEFRALNEAIDAATGVVDGALKINPRTVETTTNTDTYDSRGQYKGGSTTTQSRK